MRFVILNIIICNDLIHINIFSIYLISWMVVVLLALYFSTHPVHIQFRMVSFLTICWYLPFIPIFNVDQAHESDRNVFNSINKLTFILLIYLIAGLAEYAYILCYIWSRIVAYYGSNTATEYLWKKTFFIELI